MSRLKIAIACQGGGSQTAFTAGALKTLCEARIDNEFEVVGISGTSGGAVCATLLWYAFMKGERPVWGRMMEFWKDNTAQGPVENAINRMIVEVDTHGEHRHDADVPDQPIVAGDAVDDAVPDGRSAQGLRRFSRAAGDPHRLRRDRVLGAARGRPVLILGAANVTSGALAKFVSSREAIQVEHILASCAVPSIFPAVEIGADAYWDGLFSDNPPVEELIRPRSMGEANIPRRDLADQDQPDRAQPSVPVKPGEIIDRRNQLEGNISLFQQLGHLDMINDMILADAFTPEVPGPVRHQGAGAHPQVVPQRPRQAVSHPVLSRMPVELQDLLDYEGQDRSRRRDGDINRLIAEGEKAATRFPRAAVAARPLGRTGAARADAPPASFMPQAQRAAARSGPARQRRAGRAPPGERSG